MRKLLCLLLALLMLPLGASAEGPALSLEIPAEAIRPGKAFLLSFTVPGEGTCDLFLRSSKGETVMEVVTGLNVTAGLNQMWWNGTANGASPAEGVYDLVLQMDGAQVAGTVVVGPHAPYLTSIVPQKDAASKLLTVDFYASTAGLLTVGLWNGNVWSLLENRSVSAGMNQVIWDASAMAENTSALTLTLTDSTGYSSNEEHVLLRPEEFGIEFAAPTAEPTPIIEATPLPEEAAQPTAEPETSVVPETTPEASVAPESEPLPTEEAASLPEDGHDWDMDVTLDHSEAESAGTEEAAAAIPATPEDVVFTPSYGSPYPLTEKDEGTYWGTPMDITDVDAIWTMLTSPITVYDSTYKGQKKIYAEPDDNSRVIGMVTGTSQGLRVLETLDNGWTLIETYSSTFHDNGIKAWNMLVQGYVPTKALITKEMTDKYHIVVDKLTQRLYMFGEGRLITTLLVSTGLSNERQPYNETRSGDFLYISPTGGFWSDNMFAPMGMKFNDGDLLHEVPYVSRGSQRIYEPTEPYLGQRASHGCIRVQRKENADGYNMEWIWENRKDFGRLVVWEDWQGRQIPYPAEDTVLYCNENGGDYYHTAETCDSTDRKVTFTPFTYAELDTGDYAKLEFCPWCAPALRKAEIDEINLAHAWGGDHDPVLTKARQDWLEAQIEKYGIEALTEGELRYYQPAP